MWIKPKDRKPTHANRVPVMVYYADGPSLEVRRYKMIKNNWGKEEMAWIDPNGYSFDDERILCWFELPEPESNMLQKQSRW